MVSSNNLCNISSNNLCFLQIISTSAMEKAPLKDNPSAKVKPAAKVKCPKGISADEIYSMVIATKKQMKEASSVINENQQAIKTLADETMAMKKQMKAMDR